MCISSSGIETILAEIQPPVKRPVPLRNDSATGHKAVADLALKLLFPNRRS
jgi:hypothetical protein